MTYYFNCPHCDEEQCFQVLSEDFTVPERCHDCDEEFSEKQIDNIHEEVLNKIEKLNENES